MPATTSGADAPDWSRVAPADPVEDHVNSTDLAARPVPDLEGPAGHDARRPPVAPLGAFGVVAAAIVVGLTGLAAGLLFGVGRDQLGTSSATMIAAGIVGATLAIVAATRFWAVVVLL